MPSESSNESPGETPDESIVETPTRTLNEIVNETPLESSGPAASPLRNPYGMKRMVIKNAVFLLILPLLV
jgi:hypothetical protein